MKNLNENREAGQRLKTFANAHFRSQAALARALNIKPQNLQRYIDGTNLPGFEILKKLVELKCDINWLLTGYKQKRKNEEPDIYSSKLCAEKLNGLEKKIAELTKRIEMLGGAPELPEPTESKLRGGLFNRLRRFVCN